MLAVNLGVALLQSANALDNRDLAQYTAQYAEAEDALEEARRKTAPETNPDFDGKHCIECGEKIPAARLKLMKIRCIDCQSLKEQKTKFFGG